MPGRLTRHWCYTGLIDAGGFLLIRFDKAAAFACAQAAAAREDKGLHADVVDMMIAGIVKIAEGTLATRNTTDLEGCDIALIDPWRSRPR